MKMKQEKMYSEKDENEKEFSFSGVRYRGL
jgi:hypothetical protein